MDHEQSHHVNYMLIFIGLCILTALSVVCDVVEMSKGVVVIAVLAVATAKALLVMMFFMHLKFEGRWKYVLLMPTAILACGLPLALAPDVGLHYYTLQVPQTEYLREQGEMPDIHEAPTVEDESAGGHH